MKFVEKVASEQLQYAIDNDPNCFMKHKSELFGITKDELLIKITESEDVYDLLSGMYRDADKYVGILVHTTGWGAPLSDMEKYDYTPSEHPERKRVSLICAVTDEGVCSAMVFSDEQDDIIVTTDAEGRLTEAISECWADMTVMGIP
jgi:hypothetical protein